MESTAGGYGAELYSTTAYGVTMSTHMIRIWSEFPRNDNHFNKMHSACEDWVASYNEALTTQRFSLTRMTVSGDGVDADHTVGHWRFEWTEDVTTLLADLESALQSEVSWYRLRYHECVHDSSGSCPPWDESMTREYGTIPAGIP